MEQNMYFQKAELRELIINERCYRDVREWAELRQCYHPDTSQTRVAVTWFDDDIDTFITAAEQLSEWGENPLHYVTPGTISIHGNKAVMMSPCVITLRFNENEKEYDFISHVRLFYRAQRLEPTLVWKLRSLQTIYVQDAVVPSSPSPQQSLVIDTSLRRQSYKHLSWLLEQRGFEVSDNLPGVDLPATIDREMSGLSQWLYRK
ncbi:hypothetical protein BJX99DRAFT_257420 [Aspergillus californicus]